MGDPTGIDAYPEPTGGCGGPCSLPQVAQGTVIGFVRTDPQLDAPLGGGVEVAYDLAPWNFSAGFSAFQPWSVRLSLFGRFELAME